MEETKVLVHTANLLPKIGNQNAQTGLSLEEIAIKSRNLDAERLLKHAARIREAYNDELEDKDILKVVYAEEENALCEGCLGLPCKKRNLKGYRIVPMLNDLFGTICNALSPCKFMQAYWRKNKISKMFKASEMPMRYVGLTFDDYTVDADNRYAVDVAHALLKHPEQGAYFFGTYGSGKTMLAAIIAQEHIKLGRNVLFTKLPDLLANIRKTYSAESKISDIDVLDKIYKADVLILDDISCTRQKKFAGETLFKIIDARYNAQLQTIMTSNNRLKELETALNNPTDGEPCYDGSRIYDRCKQMLAVVELKGGSRRC